MGRTVPSITQVFLQEQGSFARFRRALRRSDQLALDSLFAAAHQHLAAAAYAAHALPFEVFLLAMLLEEHKEVLRLRRLVENLEGSIYMSDRVTGWLLDLYAHPQDGLVLWLIEDAGDQAHGLAGRRLRLTQPCAVSFYAAGPDARLRALWRYLQAQEGPIELSRTARRDLFQPQPVTVMEIRVKDPARQPALFAGAARAFPDLTFYDADIAIGLRHAARFGTFPLCKLQAVLDERMAIQSLEVLDSPWELDPAPAPFRTMTLEPDCDPRREAPRGLKIQIGRYSCQLGMPAPDAPLGAARPLLVNLAALLRRFDPDLLLTSWGDTWLLPHLLTLAEQTGLPLPLNRDEHLAAIYKKERSYQAYGQVIYRGRQVYLSGRWHIDRFNAMMFHDYGLEGILESARVTALSAQQAARLSPGTGISAMQIITALRQGVLVPWHKQQAELPKTALDLIRSDQGGLVYQPLIGLHRDVAEIDFISMYPSIMARFNISAETISVAEKPEERFSRVPELNLWVDRSTPGLIPQTLRPLLDLRIALKQSIAGLPRWDPRRKTFQAKSSALKWLLVTCFGYLGYKNARFGRIEAHQAVTAYSRECLLRAKEAAEGAGFTVLHLYVDGLWVQKPGCKSVTDIQPLLDEIVTQTGLPVALDGIYRWVAFLASRGDGRVPVANRYFGVFQDGSLKVRGLEARRRDTPFFVAQAQMALLERLAAAPDASRLPDALPELVAFLRRQIRLLRSGGVALQDLLVTQKLSRELALYRLPSPAARAAAQLQSAGKACRPGQPIKLLRILGKPGVHAWDCLPQPAGNQVDVAFYLELLLRAAEAVLQPVGMPPERLRAGALLDPTPVQARLAFPARIIGR